MRGMLRYMGVLGLAAFAGCGQSSWKNQRAQTDFHQTAEADGVTLAIIETRNGEVDADCAANGSLVTIAGKKHAEAPALGTAQQRLEQIKIIVERDAFRPEVLRIRADFPLFSEGSSGVSFRVSLPPELAVTVHTCNAPASVKAARGNVEIHTSNGRITAQALGADLIARTANGGITATDIAGNVDAVSANGSITLENVGRDRVSARTSNSSIHVNGSRGDLKLISSNGPVELKTLSLPAVPHVEVRTANGSAQVELPRTTKAALQLSTSNGRVHKDLTGAEVTRPKEGNGHFSATLNGGGGRIDVTSSNGPVRFGLIAGKPAGAEKPAEAGQPTTRH